MELTLHAERRAKNRSISQAIIDALVDYGTEYDAGNGCRAYFIGERIASMLGKAITACRNKAVILYGEQVVTVHHCEHPPRSWRRLA